MENYLLKTTIILTLFYLIYLALIRREAFFNINRGFLLSGMVISLLLPLLPNISITSQTTTVSQWIESVSISGEIVNPKMKKASDLINPLMLVYLVGVCWFAFRLFSSLGKLLFLYFRFPKTRVQGTRTVVLQGNEAPFTFFNILFIAENDITQIEECSIIEHELAHIRKGHSFDVLIAELVAIFQWFNPIVWLYKSALKLEHEFAADELVLKKGYNPIDYQQQLLEKTLGIRLMLATNNFNYSRLKNRISMMIINKSKTSSRFKYFLVIPLMGLICTFSLIDVNFASTPDDKLYDEVEIMPDYPGGIPQVRTFIAQNLTYPEIAIEQNVYGRIFVQFSVYEDGSVQDIKIMRSDIKQGTEKEVVVIGYENTGTPTSLKQKEALLALEKEAIRVVSLLKGFSPGMQDGKKVKVRYTFPIVFAFQEEKKNGK